MASQTQSSDSAAPDDANATEFEFSMPACEAGDSLAVQAPDGVTLHIKRPQNVLTGDKMHMVKGEDGKWGINYVTRAQAVSAVDTTGNIKQRSDVELQQDLNFEHIELVEIQTTKGPIKLRICPTWAPLGAQRFLQLVLDGYYTDVAIYRAVPKFLVQFGVVKDPERTGKYQAIHDDPLRGVPVKNGSICFAASGANTRKSTICIFLDDFPQLGKNPWETPIGMVHPDSMATLHSIFTGYGDMPQCGGGGPDPIELEDQGNDYIRKSFPECDFVTKAAWLKQ